VDVTVESTVAAIDILELDGAEQRVIEGSVEDCAPVSLGKLNQSFNVVEPQR
jgi:hypothetical protein